MTIFKEIKKRLGLIIALLALTGALLACRASAQPTPPAGEVQSIVSETMQALTPQASPTSIPPTATLIPPTLVPSTATSLPPTSLPAPTPILPGATRINFTPGTTYGTATGSIQPGQTFNFVLGAQQGQPMIASVSSPNNDVTMSITAQNGVSLLPASQSWSNWQGNLPATQDYYFQIIGGTQTENYTLWVSIPSRIQFATGAIAATVNGKTVDGYTTSYVVAAQGGQTMNILLSPNPNAAALTVWGFSDGQPYMRAQMGSTTFNMQLPATQDYIIDVVPQGGQVVNFTMTVEIK